MSDLISRQAVLDVVKKWFDKMQLNGDICLDGIVSLPSVENKGEWIPFSKELPPKYKKVHVSTFGIVTIGERTSDTNESLRLSILEPMNNLYKNIDPKQYQITHWQPLPKGYER